MKDNKITLIDIMTDFLIGCDKVYSNNFVLKGCMGLRQYIPKGKEIRMTQDIDFSVKDIKSWETYVDRCCEVATKNSKLGAQYSLLKRRGFAKNPNSDSIKLKAVVKNIEYIFKVDMNIKPTDMPVTDLKIKSLPVYSIYGMLQDKINVAVTRKICRRIKDLIDIYYITLYTDIDFQKLTKKSSVNEVDENYLVQKSSIQEIKHAYSKYINEDLPDFDIAYNRVCRFIEPVYEHIKGNDVKVKRWNKSKGSWN